MKCRGHYLNFTSTFKKFGLGEKNLFLSFIYTASVAMKIVSRCFAESWGKQEWRGKTHL